MQFVFVQLVAPAVQSISSSASGPTGGAQASGRLLHSGITVCQATHSSVPHARISVPPDEVSMVPLLFRSLHLVTSDQILVMPVSAAPSLAAIGMLHAGSKPLTQPPPKASQPLETPPRLATATAPLAATEVREGLPAALGLVM